MTWKSLPRWQKALLVGAAAVITAPYYIALGIVAYDAVCTHQGCTVDFDGTQFACPCHGATFSEETGDPTGGPARAPLQKFTVQESGGDLYVV